MSRESLMAEEQYKILVVDDDPTVLEMISEGLLEHHFQVFAASSPQDALQRIKGKYIHYALLDLDLGWGNITGIELGLELKKQFSDLIVVIMTGYHNIKFALEAMRNYSFHYMIKPFRIDQVVSLVERAQRELKLRQENEGLLHRINELEKENRQLKSIIKDIRPEEAGRALSLKGSDVKKRIKHSDALSSYQRQK